MTEVITADQMRQIEQAAISSGKVSGRELMERAGQGVRKAVFAHWPDLAEGTHEAIVLCGPGNNGGDGFVLARLLKQSGWKVCVYALGWDMLRRPNAVRVGAPPDARTNAQRWQDIGGQTRALDSAYGLDLCAPGHVLVVDALLGIGQNRDTTDILRNWHKEHDLMCNVSPANNLHLISIDVPTGYDTDSGTLLGDAPFEPDLTVTFHRAKPVHKLLRTQGSPVVVADIGL